MGRGLKGVSRLAAALVIIAALAASAILIKQMITAGPDMKSVEMSPGIVELDLGLIGKPRGRTCRVSAATLVAHSRAKILFTGWLEAPHGLAIQVSAVVRLVGPRNYTVPMPCLVDTLGRCVRIQAVVPGYDEPLGIEPGTYRVDICVEWLAEGSGEARLAIAVEEHG